MQPNIYFAVPTGAPRRQNRSGELIVARQTNILTAAKIKSLKTQGKYPDGAGLYLKVSKTGAKSWIYIFMFNGQRREAGFGAYPGVSLQQARVRRSEAERLRHDGIDPIRNAIGKPGQATVSFGTAALDYIADHEAGWKNARHRQQWPNTLRTYARAIWNTPIDQVEVKDVQAILRPIWHKKPETARRVRGRIERVLGAATALGLRSGHNPAALRDNLDHLLGKQRKDARRHQPAMPWTGVPALLTKLHDQNGLTARALALLIHTATRTSEVLGACWDEFDLDNGLWTIPAARMKAGKAHRIPLTPQAVDLIAALRGHETYLFPGQSNRKPLSNMAMLMLLRRMEIEDVTVHGFRSSFRDWCGECTNVPREIAEIALAHEVGSAVERAYRRGDALDKRRRLMVQWSDYLTGTGPNDD